MTILARLDEQGPLSEAAALLRTETLRVFPNAIAVRFARVDQVWDYADFTYPDEGDVNHVGFGELDATLTDTERHTLTLVKEPFITALQDCLKVAGSPDGCWAEVQVDFSRGVIDDLF